MQDNRFEWDEDKARQNLIKHKIDFDDAKLAFDDRRAIDEPDDTLHYSEDRYRIIGIAQGRLIAVFYTLRKARIRIISARKATRQEERDYAGARSIR